MYICTHVYVYTCVCIHVYIDTPAPGYMGSVRSIIRKVDVIFGDKFLVHRIAFFLTHFWSPQFQFYLLLPGNADKGNRYYTVFSKTEI